MSLLQRAIDGDARALSKLIDQHAPAIRASLHIDARWRAQIDVDDVMQITFVEAMQRIGDFDPDRPELLEPWLRSIASNNLRDAIRGLTRQKRGGERRAVSLDGEDAALAAQIAATGDTPSRIVRVDERAQRLALMLTRLPSDYAQVVKMLDLQGCSIAETAEALQRSAGAIHMLRARAHDRLRDLLGPASDVLTTS